jgi:putative endopeptidase
MNTKKHNKNKYKKTLKKKHIKKENNTSITCRSTSFNNYTSFEKKIEEVFKKNKIDFMSANYNLEKEIIKNLKQAAETKNKIKPQNDFYSYINERWLQSYNPNEHQKYFVEYDDFRLVQDKVFRELIIIIEDYIKQNKNIKTPFNVSFINFYKSTIPKYSGKSTLLNHANNNLNNIDHLIKENNLWKLLAYINQTEIVNWGSPLIWTLNADNKDPTIFRSYINGPTLSLLDINVYFNDGTNVEYKKKYIKEYIKYLNNLFTFFFGEKHDFNVEDIFNVEVKIANAFTCTILKPKKLDTSYNKITIKEAMDHFQFNWEEFSKELGFKKTPDFFITPDLNYLLCITQLLLKEWNTKQWRTFWIYLFIRNIVRFSNVGHNIFFSFHGKFERGIQEAAGFSLYKIFVCCFAFNTFLSKQYIIKYKNDQYIDYVKTMAEDLKTVFIRIIKRNKWMQPKTKETALKKLYNFTFQIGQPNKLEPDPLLNYKENDIWENLMKICKWRHNKAISLEGKKIIDFPVVDWSQVPIKFVSTQSYVVNASYTPSKNGIYVPLGYIQKPFIDLDQRGIEYNLAFIGFTLSHEMSHALDDWGSQYDENGKLNNWWTPEDKKHFRKIQEDVVKQYETFASYDKIKLNAWPTIGEDLADISGITICREYLRDIQLKNENILPIQELSFRTFFVYFAFQQRQKIGKTAINAQLKTNPHPLDKYRCNVPLSRLDSFRVIYNVKKGDKMWWHSTNKIWDD